MFGIQYHRRAKPRPAQAQEEGAASLAKEESAAQEEGAAA